MTLRYEVLSGDALRQALPSLARLRINVFCDFPYLYDGDLDYEMAYLAGYGETEDTILIGAFSSDVLVGASTGMPLKAQEPAFRDPVERAGLDSSTVFYCAESVLLRDFRGHGAGHRFFDLREKHARRLGLRWSVFCAVARPSDHPLRPETYSPLDPFWKSRGYRPLVGAVASLEWKDIGVQSETAHQLPFWGRDLTGLQTL